MDYPQLNTLEANMKTISALIFCSLFFSTLYASECKIYVTNAVANHYDREQLVTELIKKGYEVQITDPWYISGGSKVQAHATADQNGLALNLNGTGQSRLPGLNIRIADHSFNILGIIPSCQTSQKLLKNMNFDVDCEMSSELEQGRMTCVNTHYHYFSKQERATKKYTASMAKTFCDQLGKTFTKAAIAINSSSDAEIITADTIIGIAGKPGVTEAVLDFNCR